MEKDKIVECIERCTFDPITRSLIEKSEIIMPEYFEKLEAKGRQYLDEGNDLLADECFRFRNLPDADVLIHGGDVSGRKGVKPNEIPESEVLDFIEWFC